MGLPSLTRAEMVVIPNKTLRELSMPAGSGCRHEQIKRVVIPMIGNGLAPDRVFDILRPLYDPDVTNR